MLHTPQTHGTASHVRHTPAGLVALDSPPALAIVVPAGAARSVGGGGPGRDVGEGREQRGPLRSHRRGDGQRLLRCVQARALAVAALDVGAVHNEGLSARLGCWVENPDRRGGQPYQQGQ